MIASEARFLIDRLRELDWSDLDVTFRDFCGHVEPSISRLKGALDRRSTREQVSDSSTACSTAAAPISQEQGEIAATRLSEGELAALDRLRLAARVLLQNSEGCALEHYGHDYGLLGMPGWLADCERDIKQAEAVLSHLRAQRSPSAVSEDVNPNVSIAPEALSEGEKP
ncbi:MAG: hypothetical protein C4523_10630 [Myxococcales bacterium]|nr:MAG: hypothetical protein C4523_10630 [Myxococcales bacterium]